MRPRFALIWLGATAVVSAIVGVLSYQAGWAAGLATRLPAGTAFPYPYPPHFFGPGFGFFGLLPFLFLLVVLLLVFRGGRRWGPGGQGRFPGGPPAGGDPWQGWPQRPPSEQQPPPEPGRTQA
jgi:hypothetical protein